MWGARDSAAVRELRDLEVYKPAVRASEALQETPVLRVITQRTDAVAYHPLQTLNPKY